MPYADKEKQLAYFKLYNAKRKDSRKEYNQKYSKIHRERIAKVNNAWIKNNPLLVKNYRLKRKYGTTIEEYIELLEKQNGLCAICKAHHSEFGKALHLDHCHISNKVRGLLCVNCNTALGHFKEDISILQTAIEKDRCFLSTDSKKGLTKLRGDINNLKSAIKYLTV